MSKEGISDLRETLKGLLEFQAQNSFNSEEMLLFLGLLNVTMGMNVLQRRFMHQAQTSVSPLPAPAPDPMAALGQLLTGRGKGREGGGTGTNPLAGLLGSDVNVPALVSTLAALMKPVGNPQHGPEKPVEEPPPVQAPEVNEEDAVTPVDQPSTEKPPARRAGGRRDPLRWDFGGK